jgi:hypothetical protein
VRDQHDAMGALVLRGTHSVVKREPATSFTLTSLMVAL